MDIPEKIIGLRGVWRFKTHDNPEYANPDFDHSHWKFIKVPAPWYTQGFNYQGAAWYRLELEIAPGATGGRELAVVLPFIHAAYEIYLNGYRLGGLGTISKKGRLVRGELRLRKYILPLAFLNERGRNIIALRISSFQGLGGAITQELYGGSFERVEVAFERDMYWNALLTGLFFFVAVAHLFMGLGGRRDSPYIYFALLSLATGLLHSALTTILSRALSSYPANMFALHSGVALIGPLTVLFFHRFLKRERRWVEILFIAAGGICFGSFILGFFIPSFFMFYLSIVMRSYLAVSIASVLYCIVLTMSAAAHGYPGARFLSLGFIFFGLAVLNEILVYYSIYVSARLLDEGFLLFILSIQVGLSVRYSHLHLELEHVYDDLKDKIGLLERAQTQVKSSERKYRNLVEGSHDIMFSLDGMGRVQSVNNAISKHLKFGQSGVLGKSFFDLIYDLNLPGAHRFNRIMVNERFQDSLRNKRDLRFRGILQTSLGEPREFDFYFEYLGATSPEAPLFVRAAAVEEDELARILVAERQSYLLGNYIGLADLVSHRLANGVMQYGGQDAVFGVKLCLREVIINAIEHGNLRIDYEEKARAQREGNYIEFLRERQRDPLYSSKKVRVEYSLNSRRGIFRVIDEGGGFDHRTFMKREAQELNVPGQYNGRGILMARNEFDKMRYNGKGNKVTLVKRFNNGKH